MSRRPLLLTLFGLAAIAGGAWYWLTTSPAPAATAAPAHAASPRAPVVEAGPKRAAPAPAPPASHPPPAAPAPAAAAPPVVDAPPTVATLHIDSDVPGAQVFLDHTYIGTTPIDAEHVAPGSHRLNVSAEGYDPFAQDLDVTPGPRDITVKFKEIVLDAKVDVIHKHGIGSCSGTLLATPQGLRYDTTDTNDAFNVPLTDLVTFEVDYLQKNLKVKLKNGKTYNFTDPEGNADRLFVFQRDVDKARQKLKKEQR